MSDERDEIRSRISLVDLVGQSVALKRTGKTWKGLCPFHDDKNPSFTVSETTGYYRCWSCGESGDIFNWVMKTQNVEFPEALMILADRAGVVLKKRAGEPDKSLRDVRKTIMEEARAFFTTQLVQSETAAKYLEGRGLDAATVKFWELGYAPDVDIALSSHLKKKGLPLQEARALFLVEEDASGGFFDKFRGRLMFPIRDERGELVAYGGRILGDGQPKYINSGDTPLFRKSRVLYGLYQAKDAVSKGGKAVLVEGYLDVIACHLAGVNIAVASLGTSLTEEHAKLLKRWAGEVAVLYDGDAAGQKAAERALEVLTEAGNKVRVAMLPDGQDPDTLLKSAGAAAVERVAGAGLSPLEFRLALIESKLKPDQEEFWQSVVEALASSDSMTAVHAQAVRLVQQYHKGKSQENEEKTLLNDVRRARVAQGRSRKTPAHAVAAIAAQATDAKPSPQECVVFNAILLEGTREAAWAALSEGDLFETDAAKELAGHLLQDFGSKAPQGPPSDWLSRVEPESARFSMVSMDDPRFQANSESLQTNLKMLRSARERRLAASPSGAVRKDEELSDVLNRLRAAARNDPYRAFEDSHKVIEPS